MEQVVDEHGSGRRFPDSLAQQRRAKLDGVTVVRLVRMQQCIEVPVRWRAHAIAVSMT